MDKLLKSTNLDTSSLKKDFLFVGLILLALVLFFPEMFLLKSGFLSGDHRAQHYPWAFYYSECVKHFQLPWWTNAIHCGFPLLAEGQVGAFYPLNLIFYFLFPVFFAYNYEILFHYFLSGIFLYSYLRSLKISNWPSFFGTLVYLFGTAQGGYYYNIISLKVLIWLPLTFYLCDQIIEKGRKSFLFLLALVFSFQFFAGYLQYALYSIGFSIFYFVWFSIAKFWNDRKMGSLLSKAVVITTAFILSMILAAPQLLATWELAGFSNRFSFTEEFALIGSMNPLSIATLFFPHWDAFLRAELYLGAVGLFFLIVSLITKKSGKEAFFVVMAILGILLALGQFNPLYVAAIKLSHFYSFRVPSKFIYFAALAFSVLCAFGFEKWFSRDIDKSKIKSAFGIYTIISLFGVIGFFISNIVLKSYSVQIKGALQKYVESAFANSSIHTHSKEVYLEKLNQFYDAVLKCISPSDFWNLLFVGMILLSMVWIVIAGGLLKKGHLNIARFGFVLLLFANLYIYGFTSIKGNYETADFLTPKSLIVDTVKKDQSLFRIHNASSSAAAADQLPLPPHTNMLYHLQGTGAYSPLITKDYFEKMQGVGNVNDSQRFPGSDEKKLAESVGWLQLLNVKYLIVDYPIRQVWAEELNQDGNSFLYEIHDFKPRAFIENSNVPVVIESYSNQNLKLKLDSSSNQKLVLTDLYYPGWKAFVNGKPSEIQKFDNIFRSIDIQPKGEVIVEMNYQPFWKKLVMLTLIGSVICALIPLICALVRNRKCGLNPVS